MKNYLVAWSCICVLILIFTSVLSLQEKLVQLRINKINQEIYIKRSELQALKAQWNYLNNTSYLRALINKHMPELRASDHRHDFDLKRLQVLPNISAKK